MRSTLSVLITLWISVSLQAGGLDYLNALRQKAGLVPFVSQTHLQNAAQNHSDYMRQNRTSGHYEKSGDPGYTGYGPSARALAAGYPARFVSENVSNGPDSDKESIDGLFSAIYHRFGFLTLQNDEIGIGVAGDAYTYDMGNAAIRDLCLHDSGSESGSYVTGVCADASKKLDRDVFLEALNRQKADAPDLILWPPPGSGDIPPVFYEEHPDPLPDQSVTGYPVSVEFNDERFATPPAIDDFTLEDMSGTALEPLIVMNSDNDPNDEFSGYQFALFPGQRLEWGTRYVAELAYTYEGSAFTRHWCFATASLRDRADRFYRIAHESAPSLDVRSGTTYAVYVVPNDTNDYLGGVRYRYSADTSFEYVDHNTFLVTLRGKKGDYAELSFENGEKITLTIADTDTAEVPVEAHCPVEETADSSEAQTDDTTEERTDETEEEDAGAADQNGTAASDTADTPEETGSPDPQETDTAQEQREEADEDGDAADRNDTPTPEETPPADETGSDPSGNGAQPTAEAQKTSVISVEEGSTGVYRPVDASRYGISEGESSISARITEEDGLEYHVENGKGHTAVYVRIPGAEAQIDHTNRATIRLPEEIDATVTVGPDGGVDLQVGGTPRPATQLPPGTRVEIDGETIRSTLPLPERLRF